MHPGLARVIEREISNAVRNKGRCEEVDTDIERYGWKDGKTGGDQDDVDVGVFKRWYGSEAMLKVSMTLMACEQEDMQFGEWVPLYRLLTDQ